MKNTRKFFCELQAKANQKKVAMQEMLHDNTGMETYIAVLVICLVALVIGGAIYVVVNQVFPDTFTQIGAKLTELLGEWKITGA